MANRIRGSIIALLLCSLALYADNWSAWSYHLSLRFNTKSLAGNVYNFPMLIRLNPGNFSAFSQVQKGGADIRFAKAGTTGAALPYQIDRWIDGTNYNDTAEIWVRIDTVLADTTGQSITMYWGNGAAASQSNAQTVFDTAKRYAGVWHMNESPVGAGAIKDLTANGYNGSPAGTGMSASSIVPGVIGNALSFNGSSYLTLPNIAINFSRGITIACWVNYAALNNNSRLIDFGTGSVPSNNLIVGNAGSSSSVQFDLYNTNLSPAWHFSDTAANAIATNQWVYICATWDSSSGTMQIYKNGNGIASKTTPDQSGNEAAAIANVTRTSNFIGQSNQTGNGLFTGIINELQILDTARSPFWVNLSYLSQQPNPSVVCDSPVINTQPTNWGGYPGDTLGGSSSPNAFSVSATGFNLHYLWQRRDSTTQNPGSWANAPGATDTLPNYRYFPASLGDSSAKFRCIISSGPFTDTTATVTAGMCVPTTISNPNNIFGFVGDTASFSVTAGGKNLRYQWQKSINAGVAWATAPGPYAVNALKYTHVVDSTDSISLFRCLDTGNCYHNIDSSKGASITLRYHVVIDSQPQNLSVIAGQTATFRVVALGRNLSYSWEKLAPPATDTTAWTTIGASSAIYSYTALSTDSGAKFRCLIFSPDENKATAAAILSVCTSPSISVQPQYTNATIGTVAVDSVTASGTGLNYRWQKNSVAMSDVAGHYSGTGTRILSITVQPADTGTGVQFSCVITGQCGTTTSQSFSITGCSPAVLVSNPKNDTVVSGVSATFMVGVTGTNLKYQWQNDSLGIGTAFANLTGATLPALTFPAQGAQNGFHYRCIVTGDYCTPGSHQDTSSAALLTVWTPAQITVQPQNDTIMGGATATFSLKAAGTGLKYQWYSSFGPNNWQLMLDSTKASFSVATDTADTNIQYHCLVSGTSGTSVTSNAVKPCMYWAPQITTAPQNAVNICAGAQARFAVGAQGVTPLSFLWQRSATGSDPWTSDSANGKDSVYLYTASSNVNNYSFRCLVTSNSYRAVSIASNPAILTVGVSPTIIQQPSNTSAIAGLIAQFFVITSGTNLTYQWQKDTTATAPWVAIQGAVDSFYNLSTTLADTGVSFRCVITGKCGTVTSAAAAATIYRKAKANFGMNPPGGQADSADPISITFTDSSIGNLSLWRLSYGDGKVDSITSPNFLRTHSYNIPGAYTVKLIVSGLSGTDSTTKTLNIYPTGGNPIFITGKYKSSDSVILVFSDYSSLSGAPPAAPYVSSIKVWVKSGQIPVQGLDTLLGGTVAVPPLILLSTLKARGSTDTDTVKVPIALNSTDSAFGFTTQIIWNDGTATPFNSANGTLVVMHAPPPPNNLVLSANYSPWDTVTVFIDSTQKIDPALSDSIGLWFGLGADSIPNFVTSSNLQWWSASTVTGRAANRFIDTMVNTQFNIDRKTLYMALVIKGKNKLLSPIVKASTQIGRVRPANPMVLQALHLDGTTIRLSWTGIIPADSVQQIRIYYQTGAPIDTLQYQFTGLDSLLINPTAAGDTVFGLKIKTRYYFGGQIYKQGLWSVVTTASSATDSTPIDTGGPQLNVVLFGTAQFDTTVNQFKITWSVGSGDTTKKYQVGISCIPVATPSDPLPDSSMTATILKTVSVTLQSSGSYNLSLPDSLMLFDTTFHVYLWLKKTSSPWAPPVPSSSGTVSVPPFGWQHVAYKINYPGPDDTTYWVNRKIRFDVPYVSSSSAAGSYTGTIHSYALGDATGFRIVGQPFLFTTVTQTADFYIGLKCAIPAGFKLRDAKVYRFNGLANRWQVQRSTAYDTVNSYAIVSTGGDFYSPFAVMIDTLPPMITVLSNTATPLLLGKPLYDTLLITDNVGNMAWKFRCRTGDHPYTDPNYADTSIGGSLNGIDTVEVSIYKPLMLSSQSGILAYLSVDDGRNTVLKDLSPRIVLNQCNPIYSTPMKWMPLYVNTVLDTPGAKQLLRFIDTAAATPTYNNQLMRLFRYLGTNWKEYAGDNDTTFDLKAGHLLWMKTRNQLTITLGRNTELSLFDTVTVPLAPKGWTDVAIPFNFDMKLGDILNATGSGSSLADSLYYCTWSRTLDTGNYFCSPTFFPGSGIDSLNDSSKTMAYISSGFTVFNNSNQTIMLRIPPIPTTQSSYSPASSNKLAASTGWAVRVLAKAADGSTISPVYCGYNPSAAAAASFYPVPPSFASVSVNVCEEQTGALNGIKVVHSLRRGGCSYLLSFKNNETVTRNIAFHLDHTAGLSPQMQIVLFNPLNGESLAATANAMSVPVDGQSSAYRILLVGDANFIHTETINLLSANVALEKVYPNPLRGVVHLRYYMPMANVGSTIEFRVIDISGKTIWSKSLKEQEFWAGSREYIWDATTSNNQRASSGLYIVEMSAFNMKGKKLGASERKLTILSR